MTLSIHYGRPRTTKDGQTDHWGQFTYDLAQRLPESVFRRIQDLSDPNARQALLTVTAMLLERSLDTIDRRQAERPTPYGNTGVLGGTEVEQ